MLKAEPRIGLSKALLLFLLWGFGGPYGAAHASPSPDPLSLYGNEIVFDVFREAEKVGRHTVNFSMKSASDLRVTSRLDLTVTFLTIPIYAFRYQSLAIWRSGRLRELVAQINDDGEQSTVQALTKSRTVSVSGPRGEVQWNETLYPTNHWNSGVLSQKHVLNTLNGEISRVKIAAQGLERIQAEGKWIEATRYQYSGDIDTSVWYDNAGRWVKMRFTAKGGSVIDYVCARCGLSPMPEAAVN
jgi:hypothetical protein